MLYFFASNSIEKFQESKMQIGVKKAVSIINNNASPSRPKVIVTLEYETHPIFWHN
jgi:hypothetical protein